MNTKKEFTLKHLLIIAIAIIILVVTLIPIISDKIEKNQICEPANIRAQYAESITRNNSELYSVAYTSYACKNKN